MYRNVINSQILRPVSPIQNSSRQSDKKREDKQKLSCKIKNSHLKITLLAFQCF